MNLFKEVVKDSDDRLDQLGMFISFVCLVHCVATPLLVFALPFLSYSFHHPLFHLIIALLVIPLGAWAFWRGYRKHHQLWITALGILGVLVVGLAASVPHEWLHAFGHVEVTLVGSVFLITAHYFNRRSCLCHTK